MTKAGIVLFLAGVGALIVYGVYSMLCTLYRESEVPLVLKIVSPVVVGGATLLLIGVILDRLRDRAREEFEEIEY